MPIRVVFWGNSASSFSARHFARLIETPADLVGVVDVPTARRDTTNPLPAGLTDPVRTACQRAIATFEPASPNEAGFINSLAELKPDLFIAAGYALILKPTVLALPRTLAANFHASLLPNYRGKHPVFWALRNGEKWAGLSVHAMDTGIDTGDLLYQVKVRTRRDDNVASLYDRIMERSLPLVSQLIVDATNKRIPRQSQPPGTGSYYSSTKEEDFHIDWNWPAEKIRRHIMVTPGKCFAEINGQQVSFLNAETERAAQTAPPGTLLQLSRSRAVVAANPGMISSSRVQVEDNQAESFARLCRRLGLEPGDRLAE